MGQLRMSPGWPWGAVLAVILVLLEGRDCALQAALTQKYTLVYICTTVFCGGTRRLRPRKGIDTIKRICPSQHRGELSWIGTSSFHRTASLACPPSAIATTWPPITGSGWPRRGPCGGNDCQGGRDLLDQGDQ